MNKDDLLKLDNQLCFAFYTCSREIIRQYKPYLDKLGITYTQYVTMLVLWESPKISVKGLGDKLYLDSGTLTPLLKRLEASGLIIRERDAMDERSVIISLTPKGKDIKKSASEIPEKIFCSTGLSIDEAVSLREQIKKLIRQMNPK
jgi:DNA-binding MarR family transcriptional regulator